jgi:hypothetical protein
MTLPQHSKRRDRYRSQVSALQLAFTGLIPPAVRSYAVQYYPNDAVDALLGFVPSKVFSLFASESAFTPSSSCVLEEEPLPKERFDPRTTEFQRTKRLACLRKDCLPSWGSMPSSLFMPLRCSTNPGLLIRLGARGASPSPDRPSSGWSCTDRSGS